MNIQIITAPLIGGLIGLITNSLAIKMLFRPHKEIRIGKFRIPFTPGLIPKEKPRIASAISKVISRYILDEETILASLASDTIKNAFEHKYEEKLNIWKAVEISFRELLQTTGYEASAYDMEQRMCAYISNYLIEQCKEEELVRKLVEQIFESFQDSMNPLVYKVGKKALHTAQRTMIQRMEEMVDSQGKEFVSGYLHGICEEYLDKPVGETVVLLEEKIPNLKDILWEKYADMVQNKFGKFIATLNVQQIIEHKLLDYDLMELENMILEISKKELNALVWLGGLLGVVMGFVNLLF